MAMNIINQALATAHDETSPESTEAGRPASPQQASRIVLRSTSERKPVLLRPLGSPVANQRNATAPGSPCNPVVEEASKEASNQSRPSSPLSSTLVRKINRLAGDDNAKNSRSLLRLHSGDAVRVSDPLAPLNIQWLISTEDPVAPGELSRATPPPACLQEVADLPPGLPAPPAEQHRKSVMSTAEAFFHYPGPHDDEQQFAQWLRAHPLHQLFRQVYPINDAISLLGQDIRTPVHAVLEGGIRDPERFHRSLMQVCKQTDRGSMKPATLFRDAVAVSKHAAGLLQKKADFFSRFFSVLIALETVPDQHEKTRISETLRQEWMETDFAMLLGHTEARPPQAQWQAAEPARTQVSGRRTLSDAIGHGDMSPRKKQKTVHNQEASTPANDECQASPRQTPDSPRCSSPQSSDPDIAADLSPSSDKHASAIKFRNRSWKSSALKRKAKLSEREFNAWRANIPGISLSVSPARAQQSPVQQANETPVSSTTVTPAEPHEKPLS
jgi:hypothetical protein